MAIQQTTALSTSAPRHPVRATRARAGWESTLRLAGRVRIHPWAWRFRRLAERDSIDPIAIQVGSIFVASPVETNPLLFSFLVLG